MPGAGAARRAIGEDDVLSHFASAAGPAAAPGAGQGRLQSGASSEKLLERVLASLDDDKAEDVVPIDLRGRSTIADWMVICSGRSSRQVGAISEKLVERLKDEFGLAARIEGKDAGDWVLIDAGDVIVHVFRPEVRDFYQLEKMWLPSGAKPASQPEAPAGSAPAGA